MGRSKLTQCKSQRIFQKLNQEKAWTTKEKEMLLLGIKLHGTNNYDLLQGFVPRRSMFELRNFLQMHKLEGMWKPKNPEAEPPIDLWLQNLGAKDKNGCLNIGNTREICHVLKMIAICERHPPPELSFGIDYKQLYYYMATIMSGTHPKRISQPSAQLVSMCCLWLAKMTVGDDLIAAKSFLGKVNPSAEGIKVNATYSKFPLKVPPFGSINADKGLNPLGVPCEMLLLNPGDAALLGGEVYSHAAPSMPEVVENPEIVFINFPQEAQDDASKVET